MKKVLLTTLALTTLFSAAAAIADPSCVLKDGKNMLKVTISNANSSKAVKGAYDSTNAPDTNNNYITNIFNIDQGKSLQSAYCTKDFKFQGKGLTVTLGSGHTDTITQSDLNAAAGLHLVGKDNVAVNISNIKPKGYYNYDVREVTIAPPAV